MNKYLFIISVILIIFIDFISKSIALKFITNKTNLINDFFYLQNIKNTGIAFSINIPLIKIFTLALIIGIIYYYFKYEFNKKNKIIDISFILIIGGSLSNAWERLFLGGVNDFIGIKYFAIFNLADAFLCIGVFILILQNILKKEI